MGNFEQVKKNKPSEQNWVIVSGFPPHQYYSSIMNRFQTYGVILDKFLGPNWACICYELHLQAEKAVCQNWALHENEIFICVRKLRPNEVHLLRRNEIKLMMEVSNSSTYDQSTVSESIFLKDKVPITNTTRMTPVDMILTWIFSW